MVDYMRQGIEEEPRARIAVTTPECPHGLVMVIWPEGAGLAYVA